MTAAIKKIIPINQRPMCVVEGCSHRGQHKGQYKKDGTPLFRKTCIKHHGIKYGLNGWEYRIFRKDYCENIDGRLGFKCTTTIAIDAMLHVDHIDGNPKNNLEENTQTLCACCHVYKTIINGDHISDGRKTLSKKMKTAA